MSDKPVKIFDFPSQINVKNYSYQNQSINWNPGSEDYVSV